MVAPVPSAGAPAIMLGRGSALCDRWADMLGGPHNSLCEQTGDFKWLAGLCNPIIGFRFKQVIKPAARSSGWERSGRGQNSLLKGDRMNARNVPS